MKTIEYLKKFGVEPRLKPNGKIGLQGIGNLEEAVRVEIVQWAKENRETLLNELGKTQKGQKRVEEKETQPTTPEARPEKKDQIELQIEPMKNCLHGEPCGWLDAPGEKRPICRQVGMPVFDLKHCPAGRWFKENRPS